MRKTGCFTVRVSRTLGRGRIGPAALALLASVGALGISPRIASADTCANAQLRVGYSAYLPDCRAYEQVSPADKAGYDIDAGNDAVAPSGNAITYISMGAFAGSQGNDYANQYLATRGTSGWTTSGITPEHAPTTLLNQFGYQGFSQDLSHMVIWSGDQGGATPGTWNFYLRNPDGSFELMTPTQEVAPSGVLEQPGAFAGASDDFTHALIWDYAALTQDAPNDGYTKLYEWVDGQLTLVSVAPSGTPTDGEAGSGNSASPTRAISSDGSRVYWTDNAGHIYLQHNGTSSEIDISQCTSNLKGCFAGAPWSSPYWTATADGSKAYFTSPLHLTNDSTASYANYGDLYQYDAATGQLSDLTVDTQDSNGADVQGVVGASEDGSYIYFVAGGILAPGAGAGQPNLYVRHDAVTTFIATLKPADATHEWDLPFDNPHTRSLRVQISPDGSHLLFTSEAQLTSYPNGGHREIYLYSTASGALSCVSCDPNGDAPTGDASLTSPSDQYEALFAALDNMAPDGSRVFFDSPDPLVPQDSNGTTDVYEWEAVGTGSCTTTVDNGGCVYLISSGRATEASYFENASLSPSGTSGKQVYGTDVFFLTRQQLVPQDDDEAVDLYDARSGGGFAVAATPTAPCFAEDCLGPAAIAPAPPGASTVSFSGPGNVRAVRNRASVRKLTRTVRGVSFVVRVQVSSRGWLTISGRDIKPLRRWMPHAGTYRFRVVLNRLGTKQLRSAHRVRLRLRIVYAPPRAEVGARVVAVRRSR